MLTLTFPIGTVATVSKIRGRWVVTSVNQEPVTLTINDFDGDGFISNNEWDPVAGGGGGNDRGQTNYLYAGGGSAGTLYFTTGGTFSVGQNVSGIMSSLSNFFEADVSGLICFANGTVIETANGPLAIEHLSVGDLVVTRDRGLQPIRWIGQRQVTASDMASNAKLAPVRIVAGALGEGIPKRDLCVSRQHRIMLASPIAERMFGRREILVAAIKLTDWPGIFLDGQLSGVTYYHMLFDRHEVVMAEGAWTESLFTGPEALRSLPPAAREEIDLLFPDLISGEPLTEPARPIAENGARLRRLVARHMANQKPLFS
ncbi:Hint domain-containing protein [Yoonia litorea]|uniref:Hint domain-containing protein n=1 Tax=Yoonia litorea TaxID=1123755 RepID=UPI001F615DA6|nr:Hint domain-containing protein [Yoonia litorea]